jgi:hypothetical protein
MRADGRAEQAQVAEVDRRALLDGVKLANVPTLIPVLVQLTGE